MKKCSVIVEVHEYTTIDDSPTHVGWLDTKVVDFHDEAEARDWVDENALDVALGIIGKNPDEVTIRVSDWSADGVYHLDLEDAMLFIYSATFEVHQLS